MTYKAEDVVPGATFCAVHPSMTITPQPDTITVTWVEGTWVTYSRKSGHSRLQREVNDFLTLVNDPAIDKFGLRKFKQ